MRVEKVKNFYSPSKNNAISFQRTLKEHKSWGAVVDKETKETSFKILTFPFIARSIVTIEKPNGKRTEIELQNKGEGIFEKYNISPELAQAGDKYYYTLYTNTGKKLDFLKDPYSFKQNDFVGNSIIYDQSNYSWCDNKWFNTDKRRVSRIANDKNNLLPINSLRIYELNVATINKEGNFTSCKRELKRIKELGFNAIEIMPVENTYAYNWGYDGVDKLAPSNYLGGPDELKSLIDFAHNIGLNVIMDFVPNHVGPDGSILDIFGPYTSENNDFGKSFNFEGENSKYVRDYMVNCALNWVQNYHCDGLRLDMTKYTKSDLLLKQITSEINYHNPDVFLIAEDSRKGVRSNGINRWNDKSASHDERVTQPLNSYENCQNEDENTHAKRIDELNLNDPFIRLGYDSEWDFPYFHAIEAMRDFDFDNGNENDKCAMMDRFIESAINSQTKVKCLATHDEIGNNSGTRYIAKTLTRSLDLRNKISLNDFDYKRVDYISKNISKEKALNQVYWQKADLAGEMLAKLIREGKISQYSTNNYKFINEILKPLGIKEECIFSLKELYNNYKKASDKIKALYALNYAIPGIKMVFQGDERGDLTPFRFFREFNEKNNECDLYLEKGYKPGAKALYDSKLDFSKTNLEMQAFEKMSKDLNFLNMKHPSLSLGKINENYIVKHAISGVFGLDTSYKDDEIFTICNLSSSAYESYDINLPKGDWKEVLNTDDIQYSGQNHLNKKTIHSNGIDKSTLTLGANSTVFLKKIS